jgi:hypothetical protein
MLESNNGSTWGTRGTSLRILAFDLSGSTVGITGAEIDDRGKVLKIAPCHIIPKKIDPSSLGYMKSKKKLPTKLNAQTLMNTYWKDGETHVSAVEKKHRDVHVRNANNDFIKQQISEQISNLIKELGPHIILVEKNRIFNGILTSVLLGEIMGILEGICGVYNVKLRKIKVEEARGPYNISTVVKEFAINMSADELLAMEDVAKHAVQKLMKDKYRIDFKNLDESDACLIFDYWNNYVRGK